ncbi:hypothetical protein TNIN_111681 [Trichonephila inaurata madagascariensis]|uniref:Speckle-type POZ protein n=1 Tax=Trichonephila inaurata madagascariensis TaxID=2747483 RepID=A0A8X6Y8D0_9ARAC|nr:hypothetical protein TNIN_111681 [Trichonephila inaurata madagascariensis]
MMECNENEHVIDWKVERFSFCPQTTGEKFSTGQFTSQKLGNTAWQVHLYPRGTEDANYISCFLERKDDGNVGPRDISVKVEFSLVTSEGLLCKETVKSEEYCFSKGTTFGFKHFMKRDDVFGNQAIYLLKDMLTLRCRMRKCAPQIRQSYVKVRTIVDAHIPVILIPLKMFDKGPRKVIFPVSTKAEKDILLLTVWVEKDKVLEDPKQSKGKKADNTSDSTVHIDFTKKRPISPLYVSCHVKVVNNENDLPLEHSAMHMYGESPKETWNFPRFLKTSNLPEDMVQSNSLILQFNINVCDENFQTYLEDLTPATFTNIWNHRTLKYDFIKLLKSGLYSDAKLKIRDEFFPVHRSILGIRSPVFKKLFEEHASVEGTSDGKHQEFVLELTDVDGDTLKRMLDYFYSDELDVEDCASCLSLYASAHRYDFPPLKLECFDFLSVHMSVKEAFTALPLAKELDDRDLKLLASNVIADNHEYALLTDEWMQFAETEHELMIHILQHIRLNKKENPI